MAACAVTKVSQAEELLLLVPDVGEGEDYAAVGVGARGVHVEGWRVGAGWESWEATQFLEPLSESVVEVDNETVRRCCV